MSFMTSYKFLEARPETGRHRLFVKGRKFAADILYGQSVGEDARSPEELASDFGLPLEAVQEAIDYSQRNLDLIRQERAAEAARSEEFFKKYPPLMPPDYRPS